MISFYDEDTNVWYLFDEQRTGAVKAWFDQLLFGLALPELPAVEAKWREIDCDTSV